MLYKVETKILSVPVGANRQNAIRGRLMTTTPVTPHNYRADGKRTQPGAYSTSKPPETLMSSFRGDNVQLTSSFPGHPVSEANCYFSHRSDDMDIESGSMVERSL